MFDLSMEMVRQAVVFLIALVLSVAVHEFGHAFVADRLGDGTPRSQDRVTLNPLAHADPIGTILFPVIAIFTQAPLIGWGRPVMVNPAAFSRRFTMKIGHLLVAIAGPAMNVILALLVTTIYAVLLLTNVLDASSQVARGVELIIQLNWMLAFFNLIPVPPLDGGTVLAGLLPDKYDNIVQFLQQYGFIILIGLLITGLLRFFFIPARLLAEVSIYAAYLIGI